MAHEDIVNLMVATRCRKKHWTGNVVIFCTVLQRRSKHRENLTELPLSKAVSSSSRVAANKEVKQILDKPEGKDIQTRSKRVTYDSFTPEEKAWIGKRAAEYGVTVTVRHFSSPTAASQTTW